MGRPGERDRRVDGGRRRGRRRDPPQEGGRRRHQDHAQRRVGVTYTNFNLYRTGTDHSNGIEVNAGTNTNWRLNIDVQSQGGHGLVIRSGKMGMVTNVAVSSNGGDGIRVESQSGVDPTATADSSCSPTSSRRSTAGTVST